MNFEFQPFRPFWCPEVKNKAAVLTSLLGMIDDGKAERLEFTPSGFVLAISIPGETYSGAIYLYDEGTGHVFMVEVDGRSTDFSRDQIDALVPFIVNAVNKANGVNTAIVNNASGNNVRRRRHHGRGRGNPSRQQMATPAPVIA